MLELGATVPVEFVTIKDDVVAAVPVCAVNPGVKEPQPTFKSSAQSETESRNQVRLFEFVSREFDVIHKEIAANVPRLELSMKDRGNRKTSIWWKLKNGKRVRRFEAPNFLTSDLQK